MSRFEDTLVDVLAGRIRAVIGARGPGHCAQVPHVPVALADRVCETLHREMTASDRLCMVVEHPKKPWHASPAKVVEYRNESEGVGTKLVVVVPAGSHLPVEDSFGTTTFEVVDTSDVYQEARRESVAKLRELKPEVADKVDRVLDQVQHTRDFAVSDDAAARFASDVLSRPTAAGVGAAMTNLGLIPDTELLDQEDDEIGPRLQGTCNRWSG